MFSPSPRALVVMGVSGCGKSTVAQRLADRLGWTMLEGDFLHPAENVEKMRRGVPLDDADRAPWLDRIGAALAAAGPEGIVATCSALKRAYRDRLAAARPDLAFVYLEGTRALFEARVAQRHHEYMPASLLGSQFATLEAPGVDERAIAVDASATSEAQAEAAIERLGLKAAT